MLLWIAGILASAGLAIAPYWNAAKLAVIALGIGLFMVLIKLERGRRNLRRVAWLLIASGVAVALLGLVGTSWVTYKLDALGGLYSRLPHLISGVPGTLPGGFHPNEVGGTLALFAPLALALALRGSDRPLRLAAAITFLLCAAVLLLTQSRSALFGAGVACLLVPAALHRRILAATPLALLPALAWAASRGVEGPAVLLMAFDQATAYPGSINFASRMELWQRALYVIRDFPFTGIGLGSFPALTLARYPYLLAEVDLSYAHAHNFFLETAVDFGLAGLAAFLLLLATFYLMLHRAFHASPGRTRQGLALGLAAGLLAHLLFGLTDAINWGAKPNIFVWVYLGAGTLVWRAAGRPPLLPSSLSRISARHRRPLTALAAAALLSLALAAFLCRAPLLSALENNLAARELGRYALGVGWGTQGNSGELGGTRGNSGDLGGAQGVLGGLKDPGLSPQSSVLSPQSSVLRSSVLSPQSSVLRSSVLRLRSSVALDPSNAAAWRNLGWAWSALGEHADAAAALERAVALEPGNLLARYELARSYSALGDPGRSLPLYRGLRERFPMNGALKEAEEADELLYRLGAGVELLAGGRPLEAVGELRRALERSPGDLVARGYLVRALAAAGRELEAAEVRAALARFSLAPDPRIHRRYLPDLLPLLREQGFLESGALQRIASSLLSWGALEPAAPMVELLARERPGDRGTWLLSADLRLGRGDAAGAEEDLRRALALDPSEAGLHYRLGRLLESERPEEALAAHRRALALAPDHLPALRAAAALLERQGEAASAGELRGRLELLRSGLLDVAVKLGVAAGDLRLEPLPLPNADLSTGRPHPTGWSWAAWAGGQHFGEGSYLGWMEEAEGWGGERSLRVAGLWAERLPTSGSYWLDRPGGKELARAGYWAPAVPLESGALYALAFSYRTDNWQTGEARVELIPVGEQSGPSLSLPDTGGRWQRRLLLVANRRPEAVSVRPLFRNWGVGDVWFADVQISRVVPRDPWARLPSAGVAEIK